MHAVVFAPNFYFALAVSVSSGTLGSSRGSFWSVAHTLAAERSLVAYRFSCSRESLWICFLGRSLTLLENWLEGKAGVQPEQGGFLLHYLDKLVYPDISSTMLTIAAVMICALNFASSAGKVWIARLR